MKRTCLILTLLFAAGCAGVRYGGRMLVSDLDWTMAGGTTLRHNNVSYDVAPPFKEVWRYSAQGGILATPLVRDSVIVVMTMHGELQLVALGDGRRLGYESMGAPIHGTPVLNGSMLLMVLSSSKESVRMFDLRDGRDLWSSSVGPVESSPLLLDDVVVVATLQGAVVGLSPKQGEEKWRFAPST